MDSAHVANDIILTHNDVVTAFIALGVIILVLVAVIIATNADH